MLGCKTSSGAEAGQGFRVLAGCQFIKLLVSYTDPLQTINILVAVFVPGWDSSMLMPHVIGDGWPQPVSL